MVVQYASLVVPVSVCVIFGDNWGLLQVRHTEEGVTADKREHESHSHT